MNTGPPAAEAADGDALVEMARLALAGHRDDIIGYTRRQSYRLHTRSPLPRLPHC